MKPLTEIKNHKIVYDGSDGQLIIPFNFNALKQLVPWFSKDNPEGSYIYNRIKGGDGFAYVFKTNKDVIYIVYDLKNKIPTLYSGNYQIYSSWSRSIKPQEVFSIYPELSKKLDIKFTMKDRVKYKMSFTEEEITNYGNTNQFSKVVEKIIKAVSPDKKNKEIEKLYNFLGEKVVPEGDNVYGNDSDDYEQIEFENDGIKLYTSTNLYKSDYMDVSIDDDWALDNVLYDYSECEEQEEEELSYIDNYMTPDTLNNFVNFVKIFEPEYLTDGDKNIYVAANVNWEEGTITDFMDEYFQKEWDSQSWEILEAIGCSLWKGRRRDLAEYVESEITYPYVYQRGYNNDMFITTFTYMQLLQIIGITRIKNFSELREHTLNEIACCVNDVWYDSWDIDEDGHKEINDALNNVINSIRKNYENDYVERKNNRIVFNKIMADLKFIRRGYGWGGPSWSLEVAAADHSHLEKQDINIHIRKFDDKTNTVELIDRLSKDSKVINMDVEKIAEYVTNLKIPFEDAEDQSPDNK